MGNVVEKLQYIADTKTAIYNAINNSGGIVTATDTFRSYASEIANLGMVNTLSDGNTVGWYDFSNVNTITKDGNNLVSLWADRLGSGRNLAQVTEAKRPLYTATGIRFDGAAQYIKASFTLIQPEFIYIVFKQITYTNGRIILDGNNVLGGMVRQVEPSPNLKAYAGTYSNAITTLAVDTFGILRVLFNGASSKIQHNANAAVTGNFGAGTMAGFSLGTTVDGNAGYCANIEVKEIIIRNVADAEATETAIYNYLKAKYSL